ncbi:MAG: MBL fold metallo-hydrolase [Candidatus Marinimicrobia bacterium]|nr:MBL fold metallo-hydrolase [Candidatus Neomarinimicrobiota bacterium]
MLNKIGKWKVIVLETGDFRLDGGAMMGSVPKVLWEKTNPADQLNRIDLSLRCLLLDNGSQRVLIETGMGNKFNEKFKSMFAIEQTTNPLSDTLSKFGYSYENITDVILTHLHFDHSGGALSLAKNGDLVPAFPNAQYHISERNWDTGNVPNPRDRASYLKENYIPLKDAGVLKLITDNSEILPEISSYIVNGHTTGQQLIKVESEGEILVFCSDLIPLRSHLKLPWIMGYDLNALLSLEEKTKFLQDAAEGNWWLFFYHDPKTVAVKIRKGEKYYDIVDEVFRHNG